MSRKVRRVHIELDTQGISSLSGEEIRAILRAADALIFRGGRALLVKILHGSRSKDILSKELEKSPVYGYFQDLSADDVLARVDWMIEEGYLNIEYDGRLPLIVFSEKGWTIERETYAEELFQQLKTRLQEGTVPDMTEYKDRNREIIWLLLDKIAASGDVIFLPALRAWEQVDYKKVQARICGVMARLGS
jgi:hypothetical protein